MSGKGRAALRRVVAAVIVSISLIGIVASGIMAAGGSVGRGELRAFAAGAGLDVSGHAQMVRTSGGKTVVTVHAEGLQPNTTYASHVHQQACSVGDADGHYRFDPAGPAAPPNEIWQGFTTNSAGIGNGRTVVDGIAGASAVSVVVHAPGGAKIACADLG